MNSDRAALGARLEAERQRAGQLGDIREAIFGAQDGLVSTLAVVSTVSGATDDRFTVLIAGVATGLAGIFSMAAGEYLSSKSQREIALARIATERERVANERSAVQAELEYMLEQDGLSESDAAAMAQMTARNPEVLLRTFVEKEYGRSGDQPSLSQLRGETSASRLLAQPHDA